METVNDLELRDESVYPDESILKSVLENSYSAYIELLKLYDDNGMNLEWRYYKDGKAWLCKVQKKKKTIVWMSAWRGYMQAAIYLPARLTDQIYALNITEETRERIKTTKNVGKSKPCIFEIRNTDIIKDFTEVMEFKVSAK